MISSFEDPRHLLNWLENYHFVEEFSLKNLSDQSQIYYIIKKPNTKVELDALFYQQFKNALPEPLELILSYNIEGDFLKLSENEWQTIRVTMLLPGAKSEICEDFMPQNIGLKEFISADKGCFIGQEVLAKADTYQKNPKRLIGLRFSNSEFNELHSGQDISHENKNFGVITSKAPLFMKDAYQAMAVVSKKKQ